MAIKVTFDEAKTQEEKPFPKLMIYDPDKDLIVLFTEKEKGTVVWSKASQHNIGYFKNNWRKESFTDHNEPITLQNQ